MHNSSKSYIKRLLFWRKTFRLEIIIEIPKSDDPAHRILLKSDMMWKRPAIWV